MIELPPYAGYVFVGLLFAAVGAWLYRENLREKSSRTPTLDQYSRDLTKLARAGQLDPVVGRGHEIARVIQILSRRTKNNPVLIGDSGVGKTAIVEELASEIANGQVPEPLRNKRVLALDLSSLVAGTKYRGEFEKRLKTVMDEIILAQRQIILFVDEIHTLAEAGQASGAIDAADILKPSLARGDLQVVGATTMEEYRKYIEHDTTLERRFQPVIVEEPDATETLAILQGLKQRYEQHHQVRYGDDALAAAVKLADQFLVDRFFPDKAIDLLDEAGAMVRLATITHPARTPASELPTVTKRDIQTIVKEWTNDLIAFRDEAPPLAPPPSSMNQPGEPPRAQSGSAQ
ncbi:MAG: ATP-dependent Clp protease ATP-binding subunit [Candidatus Kerfeldbacteria bacterium]|nr:ATP-dependent Clp protease ATP-binding subunit [Candidatus Kerfeldbacteria bacterium]